MNLRTTPWRCVDRSSAVVLVLAIFLCANARAEGTTCDFDSNGYEDVAVGSIKHDYTSPFFEAGEIHVLYGASGGLTARPAQRFDGTMFAGHGPVRKGYFGFTIDCGDYDGDGYDDLAVSRPLFDEERPNGGRVWVLFGGKDGVGDRIAELRAPVPTRFFGMSLASGDFNADGYDDLAVGSPMQPGKTFCGGFPEPTVGVLHVYWGNEAGPGLVHVMQINRDDAWLGLTVDCTDWDSPWSGDLYNGAWLGRDLVSGDFDADGTMDLAAVFHRRLYQPTATSQGGWVVLYGFAGPLPALGGWGFDYNRIAHGTVDEPGYFARIESGDFNGDGRDDIVLSSRHEFSDEPSSVQLWFQEEDGSLQPAQQISGNEGLGASMAAGDFNGDGCEDLAVGAPTATVYEYLPNAGTVYVYPCIPGEGLDVPGAMRLQHNGRPSRRGGERLGWSMTAGNFFVGPEDDLVVGAPFYLVSDYTFEAGSMLEYQGSASGLGAGSGLPEYRWIEDDPNLPGRSGSHDQFGWGLRSSFPCNAGLSFGPIQLQCLDGGIIGPVGVPPG